MDGPRVSDKPKPPSGRAGVMLDALLGFRIVSSDHMADRVQFRFPRAKKRRIRRKWAKRRENYKTVPWDTAYRIGNTMYMHPIMVERLKREIERQNRERVRGPWL